MADERTHVDLFSGIGGFSLACEWAGVKTIAFAEIDNYASKVLKRHWPDVPNYGDVRNVPAIDDVWLVTGGVPCQPASVAGKRRGAADDRWLWPQALAAVERIRPSWVLFENPTGLLSLNDGVEFERICAALEGQGYEVQPLVIPACAVGAPHRRNRVWIVAHSKHLRWFGAEEPGSLGARVDTPTGEDGAEQLKGPSCGTGGHEAVAHSNRAWQSQSDGCEQKKRQWLINGGEDVSNAEVGTERAGLCESKQERIGQRRSSDVCSEGDVQNAESERLEGNECGELAQSRAGRFDSDITGSSWWSVEPDVGRVANGIPKRVDRLKCLGNAIVPQVAYQLIKRMIEAEQC